MYLVTEIASLRRDLLPSVDIIHLGFGQCAQISYLRGADDKYKDLEKCIFARAREDSRPPKKFEHPYYDRYCKSGIVHAELTEAMDDILMLVTYAMHAHREGELQPCGRPASQCQPAQSE